MKHPPIWVRVVAFLALLIVVALISRKCVHVTPTGTATLYVSPAGTGTACTEAQPCLLGTAKPKATTGVTVRLASGLYNVALTLTNSSSGYNAGSIWEGPPDRSAIIDPSPKSAWTQDTSGVWTTAYPTRAGDGVQACPQTVVVGGGTPYLPVATKAELAARRYWCEGTTKLVYVQTNSLTPPALADIVQANDKYGKTTLTIQDANDITLRNLTLQGSQWHGANVLGDRARFENVEMRYNIGAAINVYPYGGTTSTNAVVKDSFARWNVMQNFPRGRMVGGGWPGCIAAISGAPAITVEGTTVENCGGEGIISFGSTNVVYRNNTVRDAFSVSIYLDHAPGAIVEGNLAECHQPDPSLVYYGTTDRASTLRRMRPQGLMTADEGSTQKPNQTANVTVKNNAFVACRNITHYGQESGSGWKNLTFTNNTVIVPDTNDGVESDLAGIAPPITAANNTGNLIEHNVFYSANGKWPVWRISSSYADNAFVNSSWNANQWSSKSTTPFWHGAPPSSSAQPPPLTHDEWILRPGDPNGAGDITDAPVFQGGEGVAAYALAPGSPGYGVMGPLLGVTPTPTPTATPEPTPTPPEPTSTPSATPSATPQPTPTPTATPTAPPSPTPAPYAGVTCRYDCDANGECSPIKCVPK